jgi:hypothetical protein
MERRLIAVPEQKKPLARPAGDRAGRPRIGSEPERNLNIPRAAQGLVEKKGDGRPPIRQPMGAAPSRAWAFEGRRRPAPRAGRGIFAVRVDSRRLVCRASNSLSKNAEYRHHPSLRILARCPTSLRFAPRLVPISTFFAAT